LYQSSHRAPFRLLAAFVFGRGQSGPANSSVQMAGNLVYSHARANRLASRGQLLSLLTYLVVNETTTLNYLSMFTGKALALLQAKIQSARC